MGDSQKKIVVAGVASILLVAAVVAIVVGTSKTGGAAQPRTSDVNKAVEAICAPTNYKETCEKSLAEANTTDPKELLKLAFDAAILNIDDVLQNSPLLKEASKNPTLEGVYRVCEQVLQTAVNDLKRSIQHMEVLEARKINEYVMDIRTWLTAVIANQETCIDTFAEIDNERSKEMRGVLVTARELSSNVLAMMSDSASMLALFKVEDGGRMLVTQEPEFAMRRLLQAQRINSRTDVVVAQDGRGQFNTITKALAYLNITKKNNESAVIYVKAGLYDEQVTIDLNYVTLVGEGQTKTIITGKRSVALAQPAKSITTFDSGTLMVNGWHFMAMNIGIQNTAGPLGEQAVALRVSGDQAIFYNVTLDGYQDTLYTHTYRQYFRDCSISGTIDFVFGQSFSFYQNCKFIVRKPLPNQACMVTADGKDDENGVDGIVIQRSNITAEPALLTAIPPVKAYLGRPWKKNSTTVIMQSNIDGFIDPAGWAPWNTSNFAMDTCFYAEYMNTGAGSNTANRVQWKGFHKLTLEQAQNWTAGAHFDIGDGWIRQSGVPYVPTL